MCYNWFMDKQQRHKLYNTNLDWVKNNTIYLTIHGSHSYGTNITTSDTDYRGIVIPPKEYYLGFKSISDTYVQNEPDLSLFELKKFIKLAIENNPNVLEILFTDERHHLYVHKLGEKILNAKHEFLSKKCKNTFCGYAVSQLKRLQRHYRWIHNPPQQPPTRFECSLPEKPSIAKNQMEAINSAIKKQIDKWNWHELENVDNSTRIAIQTQFETNLCEIMQWHWVDVDDKVWESAAHQIGLESNVIEILKQEKIYTSKLKEWNQYQDWIKNRNPVRAEMEKESGYDRKHGMHLIRLQRMCKELLEAGQMNVHRPDAEELLSIRNGAWSYEDLMIHSEKLEKEINELYLTSKTLPEKIDEQKINKLCMEIIEESFKEF